MDIYITDASHRHALLSIPTFSEDSSAPRRGLAGGVAEQVPGTASGSLVLAGGPPLSRHGCYALRALSRGTRWVSSAPPLGAAAQKVRMPAVPSSPCPRPRPASGVRSEHPVSARACPRELLSSVRCGV
jgi:hypothetical protein